MKKIRVISFTEQGLRLSARMAEILKPDYEVWLYTTRTEVCADSGQGNPVIRLQDGLHTWCASVFSDSDALVFVGACGIAVRTIAPFLVSKISDPAVLAADERGRHIISLLSGHMGGGNALTAYLAARLGADPVITTASDVNGKLAVDVWAKKNHLQISDMELAKRAAARIVSGGRIPFLCEGAVNGEIPRELERRPEMKEGCGIVVSVRDKWGADVLRLTPRAVILGIGCRRGKPAAEIREQIYRILAVQQIAPESIEKLASIDLKAEEAGLLALAEELDVPFETYSAEQLRAVPGKFSVSEFVRDVTGVDNVCERAAVAALPEEEQINADFICRKTAADGVTAALVCREWSVEFE